jgi:hypothetical protein
MVIIPPLMGTRFLACGREELRFALALNKRISSIPHAIGEFKL